MTQPMAIPCRAEDRADDPAVRARSQRITERSVHAIRDAVQELADLDLVKSASTEIRVHGAAQMFKLFIVNDEEAFFGFYPVVEHTVSIDGKPLAIYDAMGKDAILFPFTPSDDDTSNDTLYVEQARIWLREGALLALRERGIAGVSARTIAAAAGVNQALVFYHYGNVVDLLGAACEEATRSRLAAWSDDLAAVRSLRELLALGRRLHAKERDLGHVSALAQLLAGAQTDPKLAESTARSLALWTAEVETVLTRVLARSPIAGVADIAGLGRAVAAAFVGIELYEGVDPAGADRALAALDQLAILVEAVDELGPVARRAVKAKATRAVAKAAKTR